MKAVILAGGKGTRLSPVTLEIPKPLIPVRKKPIVNYLVDLFLKYGVRDICVSINRVHGADFLDWKQRYYPNEAIHFVMEPDALGTFGGLYLTKEWVGDAPFFVTNGDELKELNLHEMQTFHDASGAIATVGLTEVDEPQHYGVALCEGDRIQKFLEKPNPPPSRYISSGLYLFNPQIFTYYPHQEPKFSMVEQDLFPRLAQEGKLHGYKFKGKWFDCGTFERWEKAIREWET